MSDKHQHRTDVRSWKDSDGVTITGFWGEGNEPPLPPPSDRKIVIQFQTLKAFGIEWWTRRTAFQATVTMKNWSDADIQPTSEATVEYAEWWRRVGFHIIAKPYDWLAERTWRPWARWIVGDESAS
jgi:hypothetical protein